MGLSKNVEEIKCSECPKIFRRRIKGIIGIRLHRGIKKVGTKTCGKVCSKIRWVKMRKLNGALQNKKEKERRKERKNQLNKK